MMRPNRMLGRRLTRPNPLPGTAGSGHGNAVGGYCSRQRSALGIGFRIRNRTERREIVRRSRETVINNVRF